MTKERWAQVGITIDFLVVVRTLGEFFRLKHVHGTNFSTAMAALYVGGALIAACRCWVGVCLYFFRRYTLSTWIALATVPVLLIGEIERLIRDGTVQLDTGIRDKPWKLASRTCRYAISRTWECS